MNSSNTSHLAQSRVVQCQAMNHLQQEKPMSVGHAFHDSTCVRRHGEHKQHVLCMQYDCLGTADARRTDNVHKSANDKERSADLSDGWQRFKDDGHRQEN